MTFSSGRGFFCLKNMSTSDVWHIPFQDFFKNHGVVGVFSNVHMCWHKGSVICNESRSWFYGPTLTVYDINQFWSQKENVKAYIWAAGGFSDLNSTTCTHKICLADCCPLLYIVAFFSPRLLSISVQMCLKIQIVAIEVRKQCQNNRNMEAVITGFSIL